MPFSQAIQVIYYNESWADELALTSLPISADDFQDQSCKLTENAEPAGVVLSPQAAIFSRLSTHTGETR
jgi:hypothetical protein